MQLIPQKVICKLLLNLAVVIHLTAHYIFPFQHQNGQLDKSQAAYKRLSFTGLTDLTPMYDANMCVCYDEALNLVDLCVYR